MNLCIFFTIITKSCSSTILILPFMYVKQKKLNHGSIFLFGTDPQFQCYDRGGKDQKLCAKKK